MGYPKGSVKNRWGRLKWAQLEYAVANLDSDTIHVNSGLIRDVSAWQVYSEDNALLELPITLVGQAPPPLESAAPQ